MNSPHFLKIPIYRLSQDLYYDERDKFIEKEISDSRSSQYVAEFYRQNPNEEERDRERLRNKYGGAWNYNEIIGFIELHFVGTQIRGEYWLTKGKRIVRTRKKVFEWKGHKLADEMEIPSNASNEKIFSIVQEYLNNCRKELKNRYIDTSCLEVLGPYLNWRSLMREENPYEKKGS